VWSGASLVSQSHISTLNATISLKENGSATLVPSAVTTIPSFFLNVSLIIVLLSVITDGPSGIEDIEALNAIKVSNRLCDQ